MTALRCTLVYTGTDNRSHFGDLAIPLEKIPTGDRSPEIGAYGTLFRSGDGTANLEHLHPAPRRQFIMCLQGSYELECGDGAKRRFSAGDVFLVDDTTGEGHRFRELSGPTLMAWVFLPKELDLTAWRV